MWTNGGVANVELKLQGGPQSSDKSRFCFLEIGCVEFEVVGVYSTDTFYWIGLF